MSHSDASTLRQALVDELKSKGQINTSQVEAAFRAIPRHLFVPGTPPEQVYSDQSIPTKRLDGQVVSSSSQPAIMAIMLEQLGLEPGHKVLEIGAGTGYNAALIAHIVGETGRVVTVDIDEDIVASAREHLAAANLKVQVVCADGGYGYADAAPYDRIILTAGASDLAPAWREQLKPGGRLVLPLAIREDQQLSVAFERSDEHLASLSVKACGFMMLRGASAAAPTASQVPIGPDPGLFLSVAEARSIDTGKVYEWLTGAHSDWETGIRITLYEIFFGLQLWLTLHEPYMDDLMAKGDMVERNIVPPLMGLGGEWKSVSTSVLIGKSGLAALMRPPGQPVPLGDVCDPLPPFELFVRQFGSDESLVHRLMRHIQEWDGAGRPSSEAWRIRAYPKHSDYTPAENEQVIEKRLTRLVFDRPVNLDGRYFYHS
jgi:protein-L-isoaspartate(D-aspartate) O-methyltransferase